MEVVSLILDSSNVEPPPCRFKHLNANFRLIKFNTRLLSTNIMKITKPWALFHISGSMKYILSDAKNEILSNIHVKPIKIDNRT